MFSSSDKPADCSAFRALMEDSIREGTAFIEPGSRFSLHLDACAECREALDTALLSSRLMNVARITVPEPSEVFVTRMMALVREADERESSVNPIWRPLELLASRFAVAASVLLLALSVYLAAFAPGHRPLFGNSQPEMGAAVGTLEPPAAPPSNPDDVLMSIAETPNGN